jgi:hypothetical protein
LGSGLSLGSVAQVRWLESCLGLVALVRQSELSLVTVCISIGLLRALVLVDFVLAALCLLATVAELNVLMLVPTLSLRMYE